MNKLAVLVVLGLTWSGGAGAPQGEANTPIPILSYENQPPIDGSYKWAYDTGNGIHAEEEGYLKNKGTENEAQTAQGCYSYTSPEGHFVMVQYMADEYGFRPKVTILPPGTSTEGVAPEGCTGLAPTGRNLGDGDDQNNNGPGVDEGLDPNKGSEGDDQYDPNINIDLSKLVSRRDGKCEVDANDKIIRCWCPSKDGVKYEPCTD